LRGTIKVKDDRMRFHSFRHAFKDYAREAEIPEDVNDAFTGHRGQAVARRYGSSLAYPLRPMVLAMAKYRVSDDVGRLGFHGLGDLHDTHEADVALAALYLAHVGPVDTCGVGKRLLRHPDRLATCSDRVPELAEGALMIRPVCDLRHGSDGRRMLDLRTTGSMHQSTGAEAQLGRWSWEA
jgi:hypothetical protein